MSACLRRTAALALVPVLLLAAACGGGEPPAGRLGEPVELDSRTVTLVDASGSPAFVEIEVRSAEDGAMCPGAGSMYVDQGDAGHVTLTEATSWSCTVLQEGETGRVRLLPGDPSVQLHAGQTLVLTGTDGGRAAIWVLP